MLRTIHLTLACLVAAMAASAGTTACAAGTVASVANTACTIGGLLFTFGNAAVENPDNLANVSTEAIFFTPDAQRSGFFLTGNISGTNGGGGRDGLDLGVRYSTLDGIAWTTGITTGFSGGTVNGNGNGSAFTQFFQYDANDSGNFLISDPGLSNDVSSCFIGPGSTGSLSCTRAYANGPVAATTALSGLTFGIVDDVGTSNITSAVYYVTGTAPLGDTPEPSALMMMAIGLGSLGLVAKTRRAR